MKYALRLIFLIIILCFNRFEGFTQAGTYDDQFAKIDSIAAKFKPTAAIELLDVVGRKARKEGNTAMVIKSVMYRRLFQTYLHGDDNILQIKLLTNDIAVAKQPEKSILQSLLAETLWTYYSRNVYNISQRSEVEDEGDDIATWSVKKVLTEVRNLYLASISDVQLLQNTPIGILDDVLIGDKSTRYLQPTLYDLLANNALVVFRNSRLNLDDPGSEVDLELAEKAKVIFKLIQDYHEKHGNVAAYCDAELTRLRFYKQNVSSISENLPFFKRLQELLKKSEGTEIYSNVLYELALLYKEEKVSMKAGEDNLKVAVALAERAIAAFPKSSGASHAQRLLQDIRSLSLDLDVSYFNAPGQSIDLVYSTKNFDSLYFNLYKVSLLESEIQNLGSRENYYRLLKNGNLVKSWNRSLNTKDSYRIQTLKDSIARLPIGNYILIAQNKPIIDTLNNRLVNKIVGFKVSGIMAGTRNSTDGLNSFKVFESKDGLPIQGATIEEYQQKSNRTLTDAEGMGNINKSSEHSYRALITFKDDSVHAGMNYYWQNRNKQKENSKVLLFIDRPIYRPGQTVFYKGLMVTQQDGVSAISSGQLVELIFKDVNGQEISKISQVSNEYGSFNGSFIIPVGKLNGRMQITTSFGSVEVPVEEYKRPAFELKFLASKQEYLYNDTVSVRGTALSYSGYSIANAIVKYTVKTGKIQVAEGVTKTNNQGIFRVAFFPKAKKLVKYAEDQYIVSVQVTDPAGETRFASKEIEVHGRGLDIDLIGDSEQLVIRKAKDVSIRVLTKSRNPVKANVKVQWFYLKPKARLEREGLGTGLDTSYLIRNWESTKMPLEQDVTTSDGNVKFTLKEGDLKPGYYRRVITAVSEQLDTGINDQIYLIYNSQPDSIILRSDWAMLEKQDANIGEEAIFRIAGFRDNSNVFYEINANGKVVKTGWLKVSALQTLFRVPIDKEYGESINVAFVMVQDGKWKDWNESVYIRDPLKELDVKFLSFRDKLQPGEKETWRLKITNKAGQKQQAELLATLFDASLEALKPVNTYPWTAQSRFPDNYRPWRLNSVYYGGQTSAYFLNSDFRSNIFMRSYEKLNPYGYTYYGNSSSMFAEFLKGADAEGQKRRVVKTNERLKELAYSKKLYGLVKDFSGKGIPFVNIQVNNRRVTRSDEYGVYAVNANPGDRLTFTVNTFQVNTVIVSTLGRLDVSLKDIQNNLNEVVIRGYVSRSRESTTGSTIIVSGRDVVVDFPVASVEQLQQEKVGGLGTVKKRQDNDLSETPISGSLTRIIPRTNFAETAFFYPQLRTDASGEIEIEFTIPQSLTRYKMMGFAHTKALQTLYFSKELITQKQFAISANAPRFFRSGDTIIFTAKLDNMAGKVLKGKAYLELRNALTGNVIHIFSEKTTASQNFEVGKSGNEVLSWPLVIPDGVEAITYKVVAEAGKYSDGEEQTIPVLSNSILVTEAMQLNVRGNTSKTFTMDKLLQSGNSTTMRNQSLTLTFTSNPIWNAIQALPYLMEYPYECAEQTMSRFYANSFATGILNSSPKIKTVFEEWRRSGTPILSSNLDQNAELKALLMEETPWVRNAGNEESMKKRLATLFDLNRMSTELRSNFEKLINLQNANGSFSWFKGMSEDRYITQQIVLNMSQLRYLKMIDQKNFPTFNGVLNKAMIYLDEQFKKDFSSDFKGHYAMPLHYLYARSYNNQINEELAFSKALTAGLDQISVEWVRMSTYEQALAALVLHRNGRHDAAMKIVNALKDRSEQSEEMGMSWSDNRIGWWWYQSPIETQAVLIEAFDEVANDKTAVEEMKIWLLKNKQTNDWKTTKATTAACYALLMRGYDLIEESAEPNITIGGKTTAQLGLAEPKKEAGTGYRKIVIEGFKVESNMGTVAIKNNNAGIAWGGLYWQYFEQADKVTNAGSGMTIKKELFLQSSTPTGPLLKRLNSGNILKKGDLIKVRIEIRCDRPMEYLHLKDLRSAGFEPINVLSGYKYQEGLGYYESTKDASTSFFINRMRTGVYVFEYPLRVNIAGNFSNGLTTLQSMYAPEFTTHSEGIRLTVK